jgi:hypothetical protein
MTMQTPQKIISLLAGSALFAASFLNAATTDPVGYVTLTVNGTSGVASDAYSFISPSLQNAPSATSTISNINGNTITASSATWDANVYQGAYFIEITSGANSGLTATISDNTSDTLTTLEDLSLF